MLIREWMTKDVITVTPDTSMLKASKLMKDHNIRRLPVLDGKHVVGIVSDRDIRAASPSKATTLDMHELYYLLSEVKVKDIMTSDPVTVYDTDAVDAAALLMENKGIGGLPVLQHVFHADILHDPHGPQQLFPSLCEEVGHAQRVSVRFDLADQPERPEFPQMLQQHFLRDAFNAAFQFRQPHAAVPQLEHDDRFPLASHDVVDDFQRTGAGRTDFHGSSVGEYVRSLRGAPWMTAPQGIRVPECAVPARSPDGRGRAHAPLSGKAGPPISSARVPRRFPPSPRWRG